MSTWVRRMAVVRQKLEFAVVAYRDSGSAKVYRLLVLILGALTDRASQTWYLCIFAVGLALTGLIRLAW